MWRRYRCLTDSSACWLCHLNSVRERDQRPFSTSNCSAATSQTVRWVREAFTVLQSCVIPFHWTDFSGFLHQGVVSGILLVTSNKIFFDPCKTHPLVKEHGCEEYLLSCSVDTLTSVSFFSDISHIHFNTSQQRSAMLQSSQTATRADSHARFVLCQEKRKENPPAFEEASLRPSEAKWGVDPSFGVGPFRVIWSGSKPDQRSFWGGRGG